jgi:hypothetical protein
VIRRRITDRWAIAIARVIPNAYTPARKVMSAGRTRPNAITAAPAIATYGVARRRPSFPSQLGIWRFVASV